MSATDRLNEIEARANAATEGPWTPDEYTEVDPDGFYELSRVIAPDPDGDDWCAIGVVHTGILRPDAEFIAHARADVPALVAALRAVLELHKPGEGSSQGWTLRGGYGYIEPYCAGCVASDEYAQHYPCATVRAIEEALS